MHNKKISKKSAKIVVTQSILRKKWQFENQQFKAKIIIDRREESAP